VSAAWQSVPLGSLLKKSEEVVWPAGDTRYKEITVRLWGRGVVARGEVEGLQLVGQRRFRARKGQFIASRIDSRNGALGVVPPSLEGAIVTNDFPLFDVDSERLDPGFLAWLSRTERFVELCRRASEGTTNRVRLKEERFLALEIALPPVDEQHRIVEWINAIAGKIEQVRVLRGESKVEAGACVVSLHSKLAGTRTKALGEILALDEDAKPISPDRSYPQVGVRSFGAGLFRKGALQGSDTSYRAFNRLYPGAVVLSQVKGWEGAIAVSSADLDGWYVSPEYRTFRCLPTEAVPEYLAALLPTEWFWNRLGAATRGVGARRERTRPEQFLQVRIPMPDITAQQFAVRTFFQLGVLRALQDQTLSELDATMPALLDRAFSRKL